MITKELLSKVLDDEYIQNVEYSTDYPNIVMYNHSYEVQTKNINIYELAYKCEEWLHKKGCLFTITPDEDLEWYINLITYKNKVEFRSFKKVEAIFNACQWFLDKK